MTTYLRKLAVLDIDKWAEQTLNEQELQEYRQAMTLNMQLWENYKTNGVINKEYLIYETILSTTYNTEIAIPIEEAIQIKPGQTAVMAPEIIPWMDRYIAENGNPVIVVP